MAEPTPSPSLSSSAPTVKSDGEIEEMLDRMLTRLALCDDSKLQPLLSKLLPVTISSLSSHSSAVRNKVLEILSHVNKRVKHQLQIGLPLSELWNIYSDANTAPMVRNFCIVYIEMAFDRAPTEEKGNLAPTLLVNISKLPQQHQEIILRIVTKVIGDCHSSRTDDETVANYRTVTDPRDRELFVEFCLHTILYQPSSQSRECPPGLSISQTNGVTGKQSLDRDVLLMRKLGILNVTEGMELAPELVYPLYLAASADYQEPIVKRGEELLRKKANGTNLDDSNLINKLFVLFNGTVGSQNVAPEHKVTPGSHALKAKLMSIFCRSITAANSFPATLQCIFGCIYGSETTSRLKQMGMEFTVWVFKHSQINQLKLMAPVILNAILKSLDSYSNLESDATARDTKTFAFQAIGLLAQRMPQLFRDKIDMAVRLFGALKVEPQSFRFIIQEATISLSTAYKGAPETVLKDLETPLLISSQEEQSEVRYCAVRWATYLFDLQHCPSRFICMLGAADSSLDIRDMALEGLFLLKDDGLSMNGKSDLQYPKLGVMLDYILGQQPKLLDSTEMRGQRLLFPSKTYVVMIKFLLKCFQSEFEQSKSIEGLPVFQSAVENMCLLLEHAMAFEGSVELHANASKALIVIGSCIPEMISSHYARKVSWIKQLLDHVDLDTRESAARLLGIASSNLPVDASSAIISELIASVSGTQKLRFENQHGALCAIGYITAECMSRTPSIPETLLQNTLKFLVDVVNSETASLASVAMQALGHIALRVPLPLLTNDSSSVDILTTLSEKLSKLLSGDDIKAIQKVVIAIGHMCMEETSISRLNLALGLIFSLCRSKVEDVLFAAGEALSFLWGGVPVTADVILKTNYSTLSMSSNFLMGDVNLSKSKYSTNGTNTSSEDYHCMVREAITRKLFDELLYSTRKEERCAGTVWLLSITMYCGHHPAIQKMLPEIQEAFSHLLGEHNELTQELASQGMSIVYELGDESMKKNLVNALVSTLTGSGKRKRAIKLVEDTEVFQEGAIGEGLNGGKLSTYKELCNLANEMGQPDLIYKFMDLANHQASLNSKRGAAFGFSKIAKQAGDVLKPHLRLLIPRLVRYQYDPDKNVQDAMSHIWKSLVEDSKKTIDEHFDVIIDDLLIQFGSRLWRSREASCLALADIIQGRRFDQVGKHLKKLWPAAFRAMDDIKETVRNSGEKLCRAVTSLTIRLCDVSLTDISHASQAMDIVLPVLLGEGILSKVDTIRKASIAVVMKLAKGAGIALRPHLSDLVCCMLESLSSLEDQGLNYVELHAANVGIQTEKLENLRISIAKGSPMWETLDLSLNVVDTKSLDQLVPRLAQLVRSGVGLNTRVGVANFISLLVQKVGVDVKPYTSILLKLLFPVVKEEKSGAAKRAFASACAIVLKYAATSQAQKLIEDTAALHTGDRNAQITCAILLKSYSSMASDFLSGYHASIITVIFLSRFEDDKQVSGLFEELWEENTSSEWIALQLYLAEVVSLICESITSSSWSSKKKSGKAICKLSEVLGESLESHHHVLLQAVMKEIPGRLWEGKEVLLDAIGALSKSCHKAISSNDSAIPNAILSVVSSACTKKVKKYREAALSCLEQVVRAFGHPEFFNSTFSLLFEMCNSAIPNKSGKSTSGSDATKAELDDVQEISVPNDKVLECLISCIHVAHVNDILEQQENLLHLLITSLSSAFPWTVKISTFSVIRELCSRLHKGLADSKENSTHPKMASLVQKLYDSVSRKVVDCLNTVKIAQVHISASDCLLEIFKLYGDLPLVDLTLNIELKGELLHVHEIEKNGEAKALLKACIDILDNLKPH
ncbi:proteasome-associated protein ECM29 homolog [Morus notabilis]|uniref:proteasome-associated protein ECM29 homolog n=1 Tax=Morus notabilis TaxID=981085 RepID=UPI000CED3609|nr:proteasome-associated protein ECM29 homolog [Morus notabilis]